MGRKKINEVVVYNETDTAIVEAEETETTNEENLSPREQIKDVVKEAIQEVNADLKTTKEEQDDAVREIVEGRIGGHLRHKECYLALDNADNIVLAFLPDAVEKKARGKIFQIIGELGLSIEKATTLSASKLFDEQVRPKELFDK